MTTTSDERQELEQVTILFSGDSGDGMQLTGTQFTNTSAVFGNDVSTMPDYPAEIRAPAGSLAGVSAYQLTFSSHEVYTPGDSPQVLVAMNPAALKVNLPKLLPGGVAIVNKDAFTAANLAKAGYDEDPLEDPDLRNQYKFSRVPITTLTLNALEGMDLDKKGKERCKNFFALGLLYWLFNRPLQLSLDWIETKFEKYPLIAEANSTALRTGYNYGRTARLFQVHFSVPAAAPEPGTYRIINGSAALALGFATAARLADKPLVYSSYPITPASDVLHELARLKHLDVRTVQAEDEIAAMGSAIGAAFGGAFSLTGTSGPGVCLKSEAIGLAIMLELPLVIINVQRGGPSTGLPTKTEQTDLLQCFFGRNGESPIPIIAPSRSADCFDTAIEAFRIAVRHTTPVIVLSEGFLSNSAEPWQVPHYSDFEPIEVEHLSDPDGFQPYSRDDATLARPWVVPGTPGLEHRIGGLEKEHLSGNVSYDPENHEFMCRLRAEKIERIADFIPPAEVHGPEEGELLVVGWGSSYGAIHSAVTRMVGLGKSVAQLHLRHLNPFPKNLGDVLSRYEKVLIPELNLGQLALLIRAKFLVDAVSVSKLRGQPFTITEIEEKIEELLS